VKLASLTSTGFAEWLTAHPKSVALVPVGSTEPHGPHLPLATDAIISAAAAERAVPELAAKGVGALICPEVPYGVTEFAAGFPGAVSVPRAALVAFLRAVTEGLLGQGFSHVCLVNNHLEPAHDAAVREAIEGLGARASVACPLTRRWARTLGDEFRSGACHAGRYETSLVLAAAPSLVDSDRATHLPDLTISLSDGIKTGRTSFRAMGMDDAYTGAPRAASAAEGDEMLGRLAAMIVGEVTDALTVAESPTTT
jgi:creatinine amidohydrolase